MSATVWGFIAVVLIPLGFSLLFLLLANVELFKSYGQSFLKLPVSFGRLSSTFGAVLSGICLFIFIVQSFALVQTEGSINSKSPQEMLDRKLMRGWRTERNWWISLVAATVWLLARRVSDRF